MDIEINSKSKGAILYRNVSFIDTAVDFKYDAELPKLIYRLTLKQANHFEDIVLDDVTSFTVINNKMSWVDVNDNTIQCPHCDAKFNKMLFTTVIDEPVNFCPACGEYASYEDYVKDMIKVE